MSTKQIHAPPIPVAPALPTLDVDVRVYHLKMVNPANRPARADAYRAADTAAGAPRRHDWRHLTDETGMRLEAVGGRGYEPAFTRLYEFRAA